MTIVLRLVQYFLLLVSTLLVFHVAEAYLPILFSPESQSYVEEIEDPEIARSFYGLLDNTPHSFRVSSEETFRLKVDIAVPDIESSKNIISALIIRELEGGSRVEKVVRLNPADATWESFYEPFGGDRYRKGPSYDDELGAGVYRIEVGTPDNIGKYVLSVGYIEDNNSLGFIETIRRIAGVKEFFEKSQFRVIESPFVYIPVAILTLLLGGFAYWRRKKLQNDMV